MITYVVWAIIHHFAKIGELKMVVVYAVWFRCTDVTVPSFGERESK